MVSNYLKNPEELICKRCGYQETCVKIEQHYKPFDGKKRHFITDLVLGTNNCYYKHSMDVDVEKKLDKGSRELKENSPFLIPATPPYLPYQE